MDHQESQTRRSRAARNVQRPPIVAVSDIDAFFARMQTLAPPGVPITTAWARNFNLSRHTVAMLRWLGVIDDDGGVNRELWNRVRAPASRQQALAELIHRSYEPIFRQIDVAEVDRASLDGAFMSYEMGDTARYVRAFIGLCGHAGIQVGGARPESPEAPVPPRRPAATSRSRRGPGSPPNQSEEGATPSTPAGSIASNRPAIGVNVEIPAGWSEDEIRSRLKTVQAVLDELNLR